MQTMHARVDSKGRVLIPQPLRWRLGRGDSLWIEEREEGLLIQTADPGAGPFMQWARRRGPGTVDEAALRKAEEVAWSP